MSATTLLFWKIRIKEKTYENFKIFASNSEHVLFKEVKFEIATWNVERTKICKM